MRPSRISIQTSASRLAGLAIILLVLAAPVAAESSSSSWVPVDCSERRSEVRALTGHDPVERRESHRRGVLEAQPGGPLYAPRPFPTNGEEILANLRHALLDRLYDQGPEKLSARERRIYRGLAEGTLRTEIVRVENWRLTRCSGHRPASFLHLLRLFDDSEVHGSEELARATLHPTGLLGRYGPVTEIATAAFVDLDRLPDLLERRFGVDLEPRDAQHVTVDGLPLPCGPDVPCVAFRADNTDDGDGDAVFLLDRGALLYRIDPGPGRSVTAERDARRARGLAPLGPSAADIEAPLVTRGFEWARSRLVARDDALAARQGVPGAGRGDGSLR